MFDKFTKNKKDNQQQEEEVKVVKPVKNDFDIVSLRFVLELIEKRKNGEEITKDYLNENLDILISVQENFPNSNIVDNDDGTISENLENLKANTKNVINGVQKTFSSLFNKNNKEELEEKTEEIKKSIFEVVGKIKEKTEELKENIETKIKTSKQQKEEKTEEVKKEKTVRKPKDNNSEEVKKERKTAKNKEKTEE